MRRSAFGVREFFAASGLMEAHRLWTRFGSIFAKFSNVLDGLVVMDLRRTQPSSLERYMGKSRLAAFRRYHGLPALHEQY